MKTKDEDLTNDQLREQRDAYRALYIESNRKEWEGITEDNPPRDPNSQQWLEQFLRNLLQDAKS